MASPRSDLRDLTYTAFSQQSSTDGELGRQDDIINSRKEAIRKLKDHYVTSRLKDHKVGDKKDLETQLIILTLDAIYNPDPQNVAANKQIMDKLTERPKGTFTKFAVFGDIKNQHFMGEGLKDAIDSINTQKVKSNSERTARNWTGQDVDKRLAEDPLGKLSSELMSRYINMADNKSLYGSDNVKNAILASEVFDNYSPKLKEAEYNQKFVVISAEESAKKNAASASTAAGSMTSAIAAQINDGKDTKSTLISMATSAASANVDIKTSSSTSVGDPSRASNVNAAPEVEPPLPSIPEFENLFDQVKEIQQRGSLTDAEESKALDSLVTKLEGIIQAGTKHGAGKPEDVILKEMQDAITNTFDREKLPNLTEMLRPMVPAVTLSAVYNSSPGMGPS